MLTGSPAATALDTPQEAPWGKVLIAAMLSGALPGIGHLLLKRRAGFTFLGIYLAGLVVLLPPLKLAQTYLGFIGVFTSLVTLAIFATCHLVASPSRNQTLSKLWLLFLVPLSFCISAVAANLPMRTAGLRPFTVPSPSMEPTIMQGEAIMVDLRAYRHSIPQQGDIIVFRREDLFVVKRVLAVGGSTISSRNGKLTVNGKSINEPYTQRDLGVLPYDYLRNFDDVAVPAGKFFVLGDNRDVSLDSRSPGYGFADGRSVVGRALYIMRGSRIGQPLQ